MEVDEPPGKENVHEVSLPEGNSCTVDAKEIEDNGAGLAFVSSFSPDQATSLADLGKFSQIYICSS